MKKRMRRNVRLTYVLLILMPAFVLPRVVSAQIPESLLAEFRAERELLRSGSYRVTGTVKRLDPSSSCKMPLDQEFSGFSAVDWDARLFRVDSVWPQCIEMNGDIEYVRMTRRIAYTPTMTLGTGQQEGLPDRKMINISSPGKSGGVSAVHMDVRMCGGTTRTSLRRGLAPFANSPLERFIRAFKIYPDITVTKRPGELTQITMVKKGDIDLRRKIWINESRGFTIERSEFFYRDIELVPAVDCLFVSRATWQKINGAWVPVSVSMDETTNQEWHIEMQIHWESVNTPLDPLLFTVAGLKTTPKTQVVDIRSGKPKLVRD